MVKSGEFKKGGVRTDVPFRRKFSAYAGFERQNVLARKAPRTVRRR